MELERYGLVNGQSLKIGVAGIEQEISLSGNEGTRFRENRGL
jgi:hypothetical protein